MRGVRIVPLIPRHASDGYAIGLDEVNGETIGAADCPECLGRIVADSGERRCDECGLVVDEYRFDPGPAHYRFVDEDAADSSNTGRWSIERTSRSRGEVPEPE